MVGIGILQTHKYKLQYLFLREKLISLSLLLLKLGICYLRCLGYDARRRKHDWERRKIRQRLGYVLDREGVLTNTWHVYQRLAGAKADKEDCLNTQHSNCVFHSP